jgi:hypothetical protein
VTTFDKREEAFENRFVHDEELEFKAHARRNHKLGLWAATQLGKVGQDAEEYAQALMAAEIEGGGNEALVAKLVHDFAVRKVAQSEHQIRRHMDEFLADARAEVRRT